MNWLSGYFRSLNKRLNGLLPPERLPVEVATLCEESPHPMFRISAGGLLCTMNPAARKIFTDPEWQESQPVPEFWHTLSKQVLNDDNARNVEIQLKNKWYSFTMTPVNRDHVNIYGIDFTHQRSAEGYKAYQASILDQVHDAIIATDINFNVTSWNSAAELLYGYTEEETLGKLVFDLLKTSLTVEENRKIWQQPNILHPVRITSTQHDRFGRAMIVDSVSVGILNDTGEIIGLVMANREVTQQRLIEEERERLLAEVDLERRRAEQLAAQNQEKADELDAIIQNAPEAIMVINRDLQIVLANPAAEMIYGFPIPSGTPFPLPGESYSDLKGDILPLDSYPIIQSLKSGTSIQNFEVIVTTPNEEKYIILINTAPLRDDNGDIYAAVRVFQNITDHRRLAEAMRQKETQIEVQRHLIRYKEMERQEIARDLHDGPIQDLIGVQYSLIEAMNTPHKEERMAKMMAVRATIEQQIQELRSFCSELRPPVLIPFGLAKAMWSFTSDFNKKYPELKIHLNLENDGTTLPENVRLALFRVYQEALKNIYKHASASQIWVNLTLHPDQVNLSIHDDGKGFLLPSEWIDLARNGHLGIVGMMERVEAVGGKTTLKSVLNQGTSVEIVIPLNV